LPAMAHGLADPDPAFAVVLRNIVIPQVVLGAGDSDATAYIPSPGASLEECDQQSASQKTCAFKVPLGSSPGCIVQIPVQGGVQLCLPDGAAPGDMLYLVQRLNGTWRLVRPTTDFSFLVPDVSEDSLKFRLPDGTFMDFLVPEGVDADELITWKLQHVEEEYLWGVDQVFVLPDIVDMWSPPEVVCGPYGAALQLINDMGLGQKLPVDTHGILQVGVPFCGRFQEHRQLGNFLMDSCSSEVGMHGAHIFGTDYLDYYYDWGIAQKWLRRVCPSVDLQVRVSDLCEDTLPEVGLLIGLHPEVTKGGCWFPIMASAIRSVRSGLSMFATFYEEERDTLLNMIDMYKYDGSKVEVMENPYYIGRSVDEMPDTCPMRFLVLLAAGDVTF